MTSPRPAFLFVHGWGCDPSVWDPLRAALGEGEDNVLDFGFFGTPVRLTPPPRQGLVAIGHSLGLLWLLRTRPLDWRALISINGFPRFAEGPDFTPAVPRRVIDRMIARFDLAPEAVTLDFRGRCGLEGPLPAPLHPERLRDGLVALRDWDARTALDTPVLALAGRRDPIVPAAMTAHAFQDFPAAAVEFHEDGGHVLPLTAPDWCAGHIDAFCRRIGTPS